MKNENENMIIERNRKIKTISIIISIELYETKNVEKKCRK